MRSRLLIVVFALLLLVTSSRAVTLCKEQDGTQSVEFVGSVCCGERLTSSSSAETVDTTECVGCDDTPIATLTGRPTSGPASVVQVAHTFPLEGTPFESASLLSHEHEREDGEPPLAIRPALLRS